MPPPREPGHPGAFGPDSYRGWRATSLGTITEDLERRLILRFAGPVAGRTVLDVGCGDGALLLALREAGAESGVGCDADLRMIVRAAARTAEQEAPIHYAMARAEGLPFRDASFDLVTVITVLAFISEPESALREMARVLRPGGRLVIGDLGRWSLWAASRRLRGWFGAPLWRPANFRSASTLRALAEATGLRVEQVSGAVFYPRSLRIARLIAPFDRRLGDLTTFGAAFIAVQAVKG